MQGDGGNKSGQHKNAGYVSGLRLTMCCTAAMVSETVTYPLDMLKTRTQVFAELKNQRNHPGILRLSLAVIRTEGFFQLWQGLSPALLRHLSGPSRVVYCPTLQACTLSDT
ncbi:hypothetical protein PHET_11625 [Paragonimus heterotremus]|uniref:Uncharacterized protein n=1 Tax=Paragonimus heterotremus TaxID=100268 RepID=A0A8J4T0S3_9TREM|nr:hypothetical protein PHET_11625 [Paragonimus heterotremus]